MSLRIYNTLARELQAFTPIEPGHVRMYVCGMTIYDLCHIGHARMMIAFDVVQKWLRASGYKVTYVRNITDIDDKIIKRAVERGITIRQLTDEMTAAMHDDFSTLGIDAPTHALLALVGNDFLGRERGVADGQCRHVDAAAAFLHEFREAVHVACRTVVVDRHHGIHLLLAKGADEVVGTLLHLGVGTLHGVELDAA